MAQRAHLVVGGFPLGASAGHDMDYARLALLDKLYHAGYATTCGNHFADMESVLPGVDLMVSYVAGPYPDETQCRHIEDWLAGGGKWFALHGTSGGRAMRIPGSRQRKMQRLAHHDLLGAFFLNHPPVRRFAVQIQAAEHPLLAGLPPAFDVDDELYLIEPRDDATVLLTTELAEDPSPPGFGFAYDEDTSVRADGRTRVLGLERQVGNGKVAYVALGHCHSPRSNSQPFVDASVAAGGTTPGTFRGAWETAPFGRILDNALAWGCEG